MTTNGFPNRTTTLSSLEALLMVVNGNHNVLISVQKISGYIIISVLKQGCIKTRVRYTTGVMDQYLRKLLYEARRRKQFLTDLNCII